MRVISETPRRLTEANGKGLLAMNEINELLKGENVVAISELVTSVNWEA